MNQKPSFFLLLFLLFFPASQVWAIEMELSANPAKTSIYQRILLTVKVSDGKLKSPPDIKGASAFDRSNTGTSSSFSFINGVSSSSTTYSYVLTTDKPGTYHLRAEGEGPTGKVISKEVEIVVEEADTQQGGKDGLDKIFIKVELSASEGYIHQQFNYKFKLYTAYRIQETKLTLPPFDNFWVEDVGKEKQYQETVNGQDYLVYEINKALFPQKSGTFELPPARVYCRVVTQTQQQKDPFGGFSGNPFFNDPFFSNPFANTQLVDKTVSSSGKTVLEVKPLPESPDGLTSELAGNFHLSSVISETELKVGESTTLTLQVSGDSNLNLLELPDIEIESAKIYKDKPVITQALHGDKIIYTKEFKIAIIPEKAGEIAIPTIEIPYFSIFEDKWLKMRGKEITLSVSEGMQKSLPPGEPAIEAKVDAVKPQKVSVTGRDILPAYMNDDLFTDDNIQAHVRMVFSISGILLLSFVLLIAYYQRFYRPRFDENYLRKSKATANALKALETSSKAEDISLVLRQFVGDKAGTSGNALAREEIKAILADKNVPNDISGEFLALHEELEAALYSGGQTNNSGLSPLKDRSKEIIKKLDKSL